MPSATACIHPSAYVTAGSYPAPARARIIVRSAYIANARRIEPRNVSPYTSAARTSAAFTRSTTIRRSFSVSVPVPVSAPVSGATSSTRRYLASTGSSSTSHGCTSSSTATSSTTLSSHGRPSGRAKPNARTTTRVPGGGSTRSMRAHATHLSCPRSSSHHGAASGRVGAIHASVSLTIAVDCRVYLWNATSSSAIFSCSPPTSRTTDQRSACTSRTLTRTFGVRSRPSSEPAGAAPSSIGGAPSSSAQLLGASPSSSPSSSPVSCSTSSVQRSRHRCPEVASGSSHSSTRLALNVTSSVAPLASVLASMVNAPSPPKRRGAPPSSRARSARLASSVNSHVSGGVQRTTASSGFAARATSDAARGSLMARW